MPDALDRLASPSEAVTLDESSLDELRQRRHALQVNEQALSYVRRLVQGRLDIVLDEQHHRSAGTGGRDVSALVAELPKILSEHVAGGGRGPHASVVAPTADVEDIVAEAVTSLDGIIDGARLGAIGDLADDELGTVVTRLSETELRVSQLRRGVQEAIDAVQAEIVRRYKSGQASVDALLP